MKNKFLLIFFMFILSINIFCLNSFASTELLFSNGERYNFPDFDDYVKDKEYCIVYGKNDNVGTYFILLPYDPNLYFVSLFKSGSSYTLILTPNNKRPYFDSIKYSYYCVRSSNSSSWGRNNTSDSSGFSFSAGIYGVYTTQNLKDQNDNVVFQPTPQVVGEMTIPTIQQVEEIPQVMSKVLEMIIPVGLIVLSIGLLIYLVRLVIY